MSKKEKSAPEGNELTKAEAEKSTLVNFVANNILNNITLNQVVTIVQQVALRDANQLVTDADDDKLAEIKAAFDAASKPPEDEPTGDDDKE